MAKRREPKPQSYSVAEARDNLPGLLRDAERGSLVEVTRRGQAVAVLMSVDQHRRLTRRRPDFWRALQEFRGSVDLAALGVDDAFVDAPRDPTPGRDVPP